MSNDAFLNDAIMMKYELKEYSVWCLIKTCHVIESLLTPSQVYPKISSNTMTHAARPTLVQLGQHLKFGLGCNRSNVCYCFFRSIARLTCLNNCQSWWRHQTKLFSAYRPFVRGTHQAKAGFPTKASDAKLWCFLWCASEQGLSKQLRCWRFETVWRSLWRDVTVMLIESYAKPTLHASVG